ncbi:MAG: MarR family transcriptional regulator [Alphaproteobacteria bacterium]|nr:MarR family transcriptional regulator [Alphaproteobacteria bacterium]
MVDLKSGINPLFLRQDDLRQGIELLFYAYRDFTGEPDEILASYGFGRAHHRAIYFVGRNPGVTVSELLAILKITKQSLSRVLSGLVEQGFIEQNSDPADGRRRRLTLTEKGHRLESELSATQIRRIARAYRKAGAEAVQGFREVMLGIVNAEDRARAMKPHQPAGKSRNGAAQRDNQDPDAGPRVPDN